MLMQNVTEMLQQWYGIWADGHTLLQVGIDSSLISYRELIEMYALNAALVGEVELIALLVDDGVLGLDAHQAPGS